MVNIIPIVICIIIGYINGDQVTTEYPELPDCAYNAQIQPCSCYLFKDEAHWKCNGEQITTISSELVNKLSKSQHGDRKHVREIRIFDTYIEELPAYIFGDLNISDIEIHDNWRLKSIDSQAFAGQNLQRFSFKNSPHLKHKCGDTTDIFAIIKKFKSLVKLYLNNINLKTIPAKAFNELDHLESITVIGSTITTIGERAFYALRSLNHLDISGTSIHRLEAEVLTFQTKTQEMLIRFDGNPFIDTKNFANNSLGDIGVNINLHIWVWHGDKTWSIIDEGIFRPFLTSPAKHNLYVHRATFDCNDSRNEWLKSEPTLMSKVYVKPVFNDENAKPVHCL